MKDPMRNMKIYDALNRDEQVIIHALRYAVTTNDSARAALSQAIGLLELHVDLDAGSYDFRRQIDFSQMEAVTKAAAERCYREINWINSVQDMPMPEMKRIAGQINNMNVRKVLQTAEYEFYEVLVRLCK